MTGDSEFEKGKREGRIDATLEHHSRRLAEINGNIKQFATEIGNLKTTFSDSMAKLEDGIADLRTAQAAASDRAETVASTLAKEKARIQGERDERAANQSSRWTIRSSKATVAYLFVAVGTGLVAGLETFYLLFRHG